MEYKFAFYDGSTGKIHIIIGLVVDVYEDQIKVKYIKNNKPCKNNASINSYNGGHTMPSCGCILDPPNVPKYEGPSTLFIPIANIADVSYLTTGKQNNGGVHVMLLGISATTVKAIIVRMAFFEDNIEEAIKYVDLKAGNIYDIAYESDDGTIYESRVKIISIKESSDDVCCKPGRGFVRENIGCGNSIYTDCNCSKDEFMQDPPVKKIRVMVDTSETFDGQYEYIMLDMIRNCDLIEENNENNEVDSVVDSCKSCPHRTLNCNPESCRYCTSSTSNNCSCNTIHKYDYKTHSVTVIGDAVHITDREGKTIESDMDSLIKFYLGIE